MNDVVKGIMERLETEGPLPSRDFKSESKVHGYWDNQTPKTNETYHALNLLLDASIISVVRREGNERFLAQSSYVRFGRTHLKAKIQPINGPYAGLVQISFYQHTHLTHLVITHCFHDLRLVVHHEWPVAFHLFLNRHRTYT